MTDRMTRDQVLEAIDREYERLLTLVDRLEGEAETRPVTEGGWTAKDVLAHCVLWVRALAFGLGAEVDLPDWAKRDRPPTDEQNRRYVEQYRDVPMDRVRKDLDAAVRTVVDRIRTKSDDELNVSGIPWAPDDPLWQSVSNETFGHWPEHSEDLERALLWST